MRWIVSLLLFVSINTFAGSEEKGRFEIIAAPLGRPGVFKIDRQTGQVWFCYYWTEATSGGGQAPAGVFCAPEK